jgi:tripartite-type tricarboxylate transporter receptor subunit TctC
MNLLHKVLVALAVLCFLPQVGTASEFYEGKQIVIIVSADAGTSYDLYPRLAARHIAKYIPGDPKIVVKNMPGASGMVAANWLYNVAKRDGLTLGAIHRTLPLTQALGVRQAKFDPAKFIWIGTPVQETASCFVRADGPYKKVEDIVASSKPVKMAATQPRSDIFIVPLMLNDVAGTNLKVTSGYRSIQATALAVEKGEVDGICGWGYASLKTLKSDWFKKDYIRILLQIGRAKHPDLEDIPLASDLAKPGKERILEVYNTQLSVGRPWVAPPGVPADRVKILRQAFVDVVKDPGFLADAKKAKAQVNPLPGEELQVLVEKMVDISAEDKPTLKKIFRY